MSLPDFTTDTIALSMSDPSNPARMLEANVYYVQGVNGDKPLSIGMLVMALCLDRAASMEKKMIDIMNEMEYNSDILEKLTKIETDCVNNSRKPTGEEITWLNSHGVNPNSLKLNDDYDGWITAMEKKMDSLNSFSQQKMIDLQSQTNKRDQAYDMIANTLKSFNSTLIGIANNL